MDDGFAPFSFRFEIGKLGASCQQEVKVQLAVGGECAHVQLADRDKRRSQSPLFGNGAAGRSRTDNGENPQLILSPPRMPISPQPHRLYTRQNQCNTQIREVRRWESEGRPHDLHG